MITEEHIKNYFLTKEKTIKAYLLGNEDKLFLTEDHDHIKNLFKSNKKEFRMIWYRVNYFIAVIILLLILINLNNLISPLSNLGFLLLAFPFFFKPLVHLFALKNKRNKKNIYLYKELYGEGNFKKLTKIPEISEIQAIPEIQEIQEIPEAQETQKKGLSKGLIIGIVLGIGVLLLLPQIVLMVTGEEIVKENTNHTKEEKVKATKTNTNSITEGNEEKTFYENGQLKSKDEIPDENEEEESYSNLSKPKYIHVSNRLLKRIDLEGLSLFELKIMRNEILARHGHSFTEGGAMEKYFNNQSWYSSKNLDATNLLSEIEKDNISLIKKIENEFVEYKGEINSYPITLKIKFYGEYNCNNEGSLIEGYYYYNKNGESNKLTLKGHSCGTSITIEEKDSNNKTTGIFNGVQSNGKIEGVWKNPKTDKKLDFIIRKDKSATIIGTDIIMRNGHSTSSKIVGSFKKSGEKVVVLGAYTSEEQKVLIKNEIIVTDRDGDNNTLQKGKSVTIIAINEEPPIEILISFINKKGKTKEGMVSEDDLDYINESWYKIKRDNGEIGWVFGKFIKMM